MNKIKTEVVEYYHGKVKLIGFLAYPEEGKNLSGILIAHDWSGLNELYQQRAIELAQAGYVAFSVDMYGLGQIGQTNAEKAALMTPIANDRVLLRERMGCGLDILKKAPCVNPEKLGAIGFCFGGLCVLDLARMGADIKGVVSFHGLLKSAPNCPTKEIKARMLVLHGYDDPMVSPQDVIAFCEEMKTHHADFQVNMYSNTVHAFTNPMAHDESLGTVYQPATAQKSFQTMHAFLKDILQ